MARGGEAAAGRGATSICDLAQGMCAQEIDGDEEQVRSPRVLVNAGEEGEERQQQRGLVVDAAIVGRDIVGV
jgi:hypothetical protein